MAANENRTSSCRASIWTRCLFGAAITAFVVAAPLPGPPVVWAAGPAAIVEDVIPTSSAIRPMDYLSAGRVITLGPGEELVLGYLLSCLHETITGGQVTVGETESQVVDGLVVRELVECDGGQTDLSLREASQSGGMPLRAAEDEEGAPKTITVYSTSPVFTFSDKVAEVEITPLDRIGRKRLLPVATTSLDLAKVGVRLTPGVAYEARAGAAVRRFKIARWASNAGGKIIGRLVRF